MKNAFYLALFYVLLFACANPVAPTGGAKDEDAPKVKYISPINGITNYKGNKIEIAFDEYFVFSKSTEKILITPPVSKDPNFQVKGKKLLIDFKEPLADNTTYTINLLGAVSDFHEGNVLDNVSYVFSTGSYIDSSSIEGKVVNAFDNEGVEKVTVLLFDESDTAILKGSRPKYITKTSAGGSFIIRNVKEGNYKIVAINDKNYNNQFDQTSEDISTISSTIELNGNIELKEPLFLFNEDEKTKLLAYKQLNSNKLCFYFSNPLEQINIDASIFDERDKAYLNPLKDTLFYNFNADTNFAKFYISVNNEENDTLDVSLKKMENKQKIEVEANSLYWKDSISVHFPFYISSVDVQKIELSDSSLASLPFAVIYEKEKVFIKYPFKKDIQYRLIFDTCAVQYFNDACSYYYMKDFVKLPAIEKSNLIITINKTTECNPVLQLYKGDKVFKTIPITGTECVINSLEPKQYKIRVFDDANANGKWDSGNFDKQVEPEKTVFFSQPFEIKENWDKELTITF